MRLAKYLPAILGLAMGLLGGGPAAAQTVTPTENPFHIVAGATKSVGFTLTNTTPEPVFVSTLIGSTSGLFGIAAGSDASAGISLALGQTRTFTDVFRITAFGSPGTTGILGYSFEFEGRTTGNVYGPVTGTVTLVTDSPGATVPEPSTAALMLPALGALPLWKLRRRKRKTSGAPGP